MRLKRTTIAISLRIGLYGLGPPTYIVLTASKAPIHRARLLSVIADNSIGVDIKT